MDHFIEIKRYEITCHTGGRYPKAGCIVQNIGCNHVYGYDMYGGQISCKFDMCSDCGPSMLHYCDGADRTTPISENIVRI